MAGEELFRAARKGAGLLHGNLFFREEVPADYENAPAAVEEMSQRLAQIGDGRYTRGRWILTPRLWIRLCRQRKLVLGT